MHKLLTEYLKQFHLTPVMSREEVEHWFVPQENIIDTFVVEVRGRSRMGGVFSWALASAGAVRAIREELHAPSGWEFVENGAFILGPGSPFSHSNWESPSGFIPA